MINNIVIINICYNRYCKVFMLIRIIQAPCFRMITKMYRSDGRSWDSSSGIATRLQVRQSTGRGSILGMENKVFPLSIASRPAVETIQSHIQWVPRALSRVKATGA
jgi:hypothetical protein